MATSVEAIGRLSRMANIVDFIPERVKAPFFLRVAAACIDYMLLMAVPVIWLTLGRMLGDGSGITMGAIVWSVIVILYVLNFLLLPLLMGKTLGKLLMGLSIVRSDGSEVGLVNLLLRYTVGYAATILTLGVGFLISAVNTSGRSLHDYIAGTVVVRGTKTLV